MRTERCGCEPGNTRLARSPESWTKPGRTLPWNHRSPHDPAGTLTSGCEPKTVPPAASPQMGGWAGRAAGQAGAAGLFLRKEEGRSSLSVDSFPPPHTSGGQQ